MYYNKENIQRIKDATESRLIDVVSDFVDMKKSGKDYVGTCPVCGSSGFTVSPSKGLYKCFSCNDVSGRRPLDFLMKVQGMALNDACDWLAKQFNVLVADEPAPRKPQRMMKEKSSEAMGEGTTTFCARMLAESGLTYQDVTASVYKTGDHHSVFEAKTFRPGTIDQFGNIKEGDDVIIEYYDLDGNPVTYLRKMPGKGKAEMREYMRVRWQFPDEHLDKDGRPFKYKSPAGSGTPIYIPERIRRMFHQGEPIPRLFIQEGEKKAEKACKHGIPSIAVSGIQNLGNRGSLPEDLVRIITTCNVKEVCFLFDADWCDLSTNIKINKPVDTRPRCFFQAAKNFKEYMRMLKNRGILVEIYLGHVVKNKAGDKGVDDLLSNTLYGHEDELAKDIEFASNDKGGMGKYVQLWKVTTWNDSKLAELWNLNSAEKFAEQHKDILSQLQEFTIGRNTWKFDEQGKLINALPWDDNEKFWIETACEDKNGNTVYKFEYDYVAARNFFQNRGVGKYRIMDSDQYLFIHEQAPVVHVIDLEEARDIMFDFAEQNCSRRVQNALLKGGTQYVGPFQMARLSVRKPEFIKASRDEQFFYFANSCWRISANQVDEVGYESLRHFIWSEQRKQFSAKYLGAPLVKFWQMDNSTAADGATQYGYKLSEAGKQCHFLQFLINASNFTWRKSKEEVEDSELKENNQHLLSKLCAIGYMMMECKDANVTRAVIAMDGKQSEVGESNGRSGKSLIGELMRQAVGTVYISGKRNDLFNDAFLWNDIDERTRLVFIDDVLQNFNFEFLFPYLTGDWTVNKKGGARITYPFAKSPKVYIPTNHAIRGNGSSFTDRQWLIAFSDYYNDGHKPMDDFGMLFFAEWDFEQWNLTWNLLATCVQLYLQFGVIQAPGERLMQRKLRQEIGEAFISWADAYFSNDEHLQRTPRKDIYEALCEYDPAQRKYTSPQAFKSKIKMYCEFKDMVFNPQKYDSISGKPLYYDKDGKPIIDDKSGGIEYFTFSKKAGDVPEQKDPMGLAVAEQSTLEF